MSARLTLHLLEERLAICRLPPSAAIPPWAAGGAFLSITRTADELSVVCAESAAPGDARCERGWRALKVEGPLDFALTGILASIAVPLADARVGIFAVSTFDTDYVLVKEDSLAEALRALTAAGHTVYRP
ncbi:MAG: ACT domain-containing protein [Acidobacteria bacterium]|nr:ACT domain-containing protein [Acidobacteriota bacterium]